MVECYQQVKRELTDLVYWIRDGERTLEDAAEKLREAREKLKEPIDIQREKLKAELEETYGRPLNRKFWSSSLGYQRLKRAREEVKAQEDDQERRRQEYIEAVERGKRDREQWIREQRAAVRRSQIKLVSDRTKGPK